MRKITMKNIVRTLGAFMLTAFFVSGCSNFLDFDKRSENSTEGKGRLVFNASQSRNAQTVMPDSLDLERDLGISFTLYGTKEGGTEVKLGRWEKEVVQAEDIEGDEGLIPHYGSVWAGASPSLSARAPAQVEELVSAYEKMRSDTSILVDTGNWTFRLEVSDYNDEKILQKTVFKTIVTGTNNIDFGTMEEAEGDTAAKGRIEVYLGYSEEVRSRLKCVRATLKKYGDETDAGETSGVYVDERFSSVTYETEAKKGK